MPISANKDNLRRYVEEVCARSPRYPGSKGEARTAEYIATEGKRLELDTTTEEFQYLHHQPDYSELEILAPVAGALDSLPLCYAASGSAEGDAIYVGPGTKEDFELLQRQGIELKGKIVLVSSSAPFFPYPIAQQYGAAGVIIISDAPGNLPRAGNATLDHQAGQIPAVIVPALGGQRLLALMSTGKLKLRLGLTGEFSTKTSANIIMSVPGTTMTDEQVIFTAHYDSHNLGKHANDNASGCAALMELASIFKKLKPACTAKFVFCGVEEFGLYGSYAYAERHGAELPKIRAVVNLDGMGNAHDSRFELMTTTEIRPFALNIVRKLGKDVKHDAEPRPTSDQYPFQIKGVPAVWLCGESLSVYYHTAKDDPEILAYDKLKLLADIQGEIAYQLATQERLPFR